MEGEETNVTGNGRYFLLILGRVRISVSIIGILMQVSSGMKASGVRKMKEMLLVRARDDDAY